MKLKVYNSEQFQAGVHSCLCSVCSMHTHIRIVLIRSKGILSKYNVLTCVISHSVACRVLPVDGTLVLKNVGILILVYELYLIKFIWWITDYKNMHSIKNMKNSLP